jgi:hypothetical protein
MEEDIEIDATTWVERSGAILKKEIASLVSHAAPRNSRPPVLHSLEVFLSKVCEGGSGLFSLLCVRTRRILADGCERWRSQRYNELVDTSQIRTDLAAHRIGIVPFHIP